MKIENQPSFVSPAQNSNDKVVDDKKPASGMRKAQNPLQVSRNLTRNSEKTSIVSRGQRQVNIIPAGYAKTVRDYSDLLSKTMSAIPDVEDLAGNAVIKILEEHKDAKGNKNPVRNKNDGSPLDPDRTYVHFFNNAMNNSKTYSGWEHEKSKGQLTLTQAMINNFDASWQNQLPADVNTQAGIYTAGPEATKFDETNEVQYLASDLRDAIRKADFQKQVSEAQEKFWSEHQQDWRLMAKAGFVGQARNALVSGTLSDSGYELVMRGGAPNIDLKDTATLEQLKGSAPPDSSVQVCRLDINGYESSDILCFTGTKEDPRQIMYLPGQKNPFLEFANGEALRNWVTEQAENPETRDALAQHFSLHNRQDRVSWFGHTGVDNGLKKLASREWSSNSINTKSYSTIRDKDVFDDLAEQTRQRGKSDADTLITSNGEVDLDMWKNYLKACNFILGPIALVGGPIAGSAALGFFVFQLGIEAYQAVAGDTEQRRQQALKELTGDVATTLLFAGLTHGAGKEPVFSQSHTNLSKVFENPSLETSALADHFNSDGSRLTYRDILNRHQTEREWSALPDYGKVSWLVRTTSHSHDANILARLTTPETVEQSIRRNLALNDGGKDKSGFVWDDLTTEQANAQRRLKSDLTRLTVTDAHIRGLLREPPTVLRTTRHGEPEAAAAKWIAGPHQSARLEEDILEVISNYRDADLLDMGTISAIHDAVSKSVGSQAQRTFRPSSDPVVMGTDVAHAGFERMLGEIRKKVDAGKADLGDMLFAAMKSYCPFANGNSRTARTLYALARLQKEKGSFMALTAQGADVLNQYGSTPQGSRPQRLDDGRVGFLASPVQPHKFPKLDETAQSSGSSGFPLEPRPSGMVGISTAFPGMKIKIPLDDTIEQSPGRFSVIKDGYATPVGWDVDAEGWRQLDNNGAASTTFLWRTRQNQWESGTREEFSEVKNSLPAPTKFKTIELASIPAIPAQATPIPKEIHYIWVGGEIPKNLTNIILQNSRNSPGYKSIVHVDANDENIFRKIKDDLDHRVGGLEVIDLKSEDFFRDLNAGNSGEMYQYFRSAERGNNLSAAADVLRFPLINKYGGIYLDTDDSISQNVGQVELKATSNDVLLNGHVKHERTEFSGYNTSNFASQPDNPVLRKISKEMNNRYRENILSLKGGRPYLGVNPDANSEMLFAEYQKKIFNMTGPRLFDDILKEERPDYYNLSAQRDNPVNFIPPEAYLDAQNKAVDYYLPFDKKFKVEIGAEQSMEHTR